MAEKNHTLLTLGAGALIGVKAHDMYMKHKRGEEEKTQAPVTPHVYAPAIVSGETIQDWTKYSRDFMMKYGNAMINIAWNHLEELEKDLSAIKKMNAEWYDMFPAAMPYDRQAMEDWLMRKGLNSNLSGKCLLIMVGIYGPRFDPDGELGSFIPAKNACRTSPHLTMGAVSKFDVKKKSSTMDYIRACYTAMDTTMNNIAAEIKRMGLKPRVVVSPMETDKFYSIYSIEFTHDIRDLV